MSALSVIEFKWYAENLYRIPMVRNKFISPSTGTQQIYVGLPMVRSKKQYIGFQWYAVVDMGGGGWWDISGTQLIYTRFQWYEANVYRIPAVRS